MAKAKLNVQSEKELQKLMERNENEFGRHFHSREQYEYFMMLPISENQRKELLSALLRKEKDLKYEDDQ